MICISGNGKAWNYAYARLARNKMFNLQSESVDQRLFGPPTRSRVFLAAAALGWLFRKFWISNHRNKRKKWLPFFCVPYSKFHVPGKYYSRPFGLKIYKFLPQPKTVPAAVSTKEWSTPAETESAEIPDKAPPTIFGVCLKATLKNSFGENEKKSKYVPLNKVTWP